SESCNGLDPTKADSDGDGLPDNLEERDLNGIIELFMGETDPRIYDTDGDGISDKDFGARICFPDAQVTVTRVPLPGTGIQLGHDGGFGETKPIAGTLNRGAIVVDAAAASVAGLVVGAPAVIAAFTDDATTVESNVL